MLKKLIYLVQYIAVLPIFYLFKILPLSFSSALVGKMLLGFSYFSKTDKIVKANLRVIFPEKSDEEIHKIAKKSWENAGRIFGELATMCSVKVEKIQKYFDIEISPDVQKVFDEKQPAIYVSAHYGNWELASQILTYMDSRTAFIYRKINNPYIENFLRKMRENYLNMVIQKGDSKSLKQALIHLKKGGSLGILSDQKMREGVEVEFFGKKVKAPSTQADFSIKFGLPVIMARLVRVNKIKFKFLFEEVLDTDGKSPEQVTQEIYETYERWIKEYPEQWFLMHNRFGFHKPDLFKT